MLNSSCKEDILSLIPTLNLTFFNLEYGRNLLLTLIVLYETI